MTPQQLEEIRQRNKAVRACAVTGEQKCRPYDHDSALVCTIHDRPEQSVADIDALLAEVERLSDDLYDI